MSRTRRERTPFSANRQRLALKFSDKDFEDRFVVRWFNDTEDRISRALDGGYEFLSPDEIIGVGDRDVHSGNQDLNSKVSRIVNGRRDGNPEVRAFAMKIRKDWYEEDQAKKEDRNKLVDIAINAGKAGGADIENKYGQVTQESESRRS